MIVIVVIIVINTNNNESNIILEYLQILELDHQLIGRTTRVTQARTVRGFPHGASPRYIVRATGAHTDVNGFILDSVEDPGHFPQLLPAAAHSSRSEGI